MLAIERVGAGELERLVVVGGEVDEVLVLHLADELRERIGDLEVRSFDEVPLFLEVLVQLDLYSAVDGASDRFEHVECTERAIARAGAVIVLAEGSDSGEGADAAG